MHILYYSHNNKLLNYSEKQTFVNVLTIIVPPVCVRKGFSTFRCTRKLGRTRRGGISVMVATTIDH